MATDNTSSREVATFLWLVESLSHAIDMYSGSNVLFFNAIISNVLSASPSVLSVTYNGWFHGNVLHAMVLAIVFPERGKTLTKRQQMEAASVIHDLISTRSMHHLLSERDSLGFTPLELCKYYTERCLQRPAYACYDESTVQFLKGALLDGVDVRSVSVM